MLKKSGVALIGSLLVAGAAAAQTADGGSDGLSVEDKQHIEALYNAQQPASEDSTAPAMLTREDIAGYRSESGWGKAFKEMQAKGYFQEYKNFGELISASKSQRGVTESDGAKAKALGIDRAGIDKANKISKPQRVSRIDRPNRPNRPNRPQIR